MSLKSETYMCIQKAQDININKCILYKYICSPRTFQETHAQEREDEIRVLSCEEGEKMTLKQ